MAHVNVLSMCPLGALSSHTGEASQRKCFFEYQGTDG